MSRSGRGLVLVGCVLAARFLTSASLAVAAPIIDQQQPVIDLAVGPLFVGGTSQQKLAQTVTAGLSGVLTEVRFPVACDFGNLSVQIQGVTGGVPNGTVLAEQIFPAASLPPFFPVPGVVTLRSLPFSSPASVSIGQQFAVVLTSDGGCGVFQGPLGDSYGGGNAFFDALPNPPGWVCSCIFAGARFDLPFQTLVDPTLQIDIDIKPGSAPNSINMRSQGLIPVAILSSATFDAVARVNPTSLTFGRTGDELSLAFCNASGEDVNSDGLPDLVCHFHTPETGFQPGDAVGVLKGTAAGDVNVVGSDSVRILGP